MNVGHHEERFSIVFILVNDMFFSFVDDPLLIASRSSDVALARFQQFQSRVKKCEVGLGFVFWSSGESPAVDEYDPSKEENSGSDYDRRDDL